MHPLDNPLLDRRVVLCVSGGIAAYKSVLLLRLLIKKGASVQVAMTQSAQQFVGPLTFGALSGKPVFTNLFDIQQDAEIGHIRIADGADLIVVAPATANVMARITAGMANDPVTAAVMASRAPVLLAPAMNVNMWQSAAVKDNVTRLAERGMWFVGPDEGFLACKWTGAGRLSEPEDISEAAAAILAPQDLAGTHVVISAGGTQEDIDPVRFLGNRSTGKMGYALARAAARRGAQVTLVSGPSCENVLRGVRLVSVRSASEMDGAVQQASATADVVVMAAAVADYRPEQQANHKLKKSSWGAEPSIVLTRTVDILASLGASRSGRRPFLVGFAAETEAIAEAAQGKLVRKRCDMIVANDVGRSDRGLGSDNNAVELFCASGHRSFLALASKDSIAHGIFDQVLVEMAAH